MASNPRVAVVVDSTVCLPESSIKETELLVVPINILLEGISYKDGDLSTDEFYRRLKTATRPPTTSAPSPGSFLETFTKASQQVNAILCLTLPSNLSATYNAACIAAASLRKTSPATSITILDSQTAGPAQGFIALEAARAAREGAELEEVTEIAKAMIPKTRLIAMLDTLYYLWRGGRVPKVGVWASNIFNIKPVLELSQGKVHLRSLNRTQDKAIQKLLTLLRREVTSGLLHVNVVHTNVPTKALELHERIQRSVPCSEALITEITTAMGVHTGPGLVGIAFYVEDSTNTTNSTYRYGA